MNEKQLAEDLAREIRRMALKVAIVCGGLSALMFIILSLSGCYMTTYDYQPIDYQETQYERERNRELIHQHGMGGCTPNFSTGGCL